VPPTAAAAPAGPARALAAGAGGSNLNKEPLDPTFLARLATGMLPIATDAGKIHSLARRLKAVRRRGERGGRVCLFVFPPDAGAPKHGRG
jgi:hypothetical protein